jgi:hypothetical protein
VDTKTNEISRFQPLLEGLDLPGGAPYCARRHPSPATAWHHKPMKPILRRLAEALPHVVVARPGISLRRPKHWS